MGQNNSCFQELRLFRFNGRRKTRSTNAEAASGNTANIPAVKTDVMAESINTPKETFRNYLRLNSENAATYATSSKEDIPKIQIPDFEIKDGTLILTPSKEDSSFSASPVSSVSAFRVLTKSFKEDLRKTSEQVCENTYHHDLPYIPPKPSIDFLKNDLNDENSQKFGPKTGTLTSRPLPPQIPPRRHELILNPSNPISSRCNLTDPSNHISSGRNLVDSDNAISSRGNIINLRAPPQIPARQFERY